MTFTKKKLAAVISGSLLTGMASTAGAAVNLDANIVAPAGSQTANVASEINIPGTGLVVTNANATFIDTVSVLNPSVIPANSDVRVTVTLGGTAVFSATPTASINAGAITMGVIGGGTGTNSFEFNANVGTADLAAAGTFNLTAPSVTVTDQSAVSITVDASRADNFGTAAVKSITSGYIGFKDSYAVTFVPLATTNNIDVTNGSVIFATAAGATALTSTLGTSTATYTAGTDNTGTAIATQATLGNAVTVTLNGSNGLDAFSSSNAGASVALGAIATTVTGTAAATSAQTAAGASGALIAVVTVPAANAVLIQETPVTVTYAGTPASGYNLDSLNKTGSLSSLSKNGSSARLSFALTPGGAYPQFIRVTNPSGIDGDVSLTLTNDDGLTSAGIGIGDIDGKTGDGLVSGASTGLLTIEAVYAAVQAADPTFVLGTNSNKLRVGVNAEFGASGGSTGVILSAFSTSTDGNTFNMMTDASN